MTPEAVPAPAVRSWNWINALPLVWVVGFAVLMLRLSAARWMLWSSERLATVIRRRVAPQLAFESRSDSATEQDPIFMAMEAICSQLGISRPVTLLIHPNKTIPVVWGILRCRLMLPAAARQWSDEQLRSVLLHELAHIKRRDTVVQLLAQIACALHWFNPLVWFAAWRLDVERERSCDDLVLASGIRPSAYAGHLLDVVTGLSPARWTQACGLAMARKSSLEGRLTAVLGKDLDRRGVSVALAGLALAVAVGVAVPIAMLRAADEKREDVTQNSKTTFKLRPETIAKLKWGEPMNGLRMALAWPPALGEPALGDSQEFYLVVQNVSQAAVRLTANDAAPNPRKLLLQDDRPVAITVDDVPIPGDWLLQPREAAFVRLFHSNEKREDGRTISAVKEQVVRVIPKYSYIAEMSIEKAPPGAWTGKLFTGATRGSADVAAVPAPMHKDARSLYEIWLRHARGNGDIPGAMVGELAGGVRRFVRYNPTWKTVPTLNALLPRLDGTRDWKPAEAISLLDEIAAIQDSPLSMVTGDEDDRVIVTGKPLPKELADKEWLWGWGKADASGLRIAWDLQPRDPRLQLSIEEGYLSTVRLGTALKGRLLVHNSGDKPVVLRVPTWYQGRVTAVDKDQKTIEIPGISWTTLSSLVTHRLAPGDYVVIRAPGIGFGKDAGHGPWAGPRVGWNVMAKPGDRVPLTLKPVPFDGSEVGRREDRPFEDGPNWWPGFIKARFARELPLPATAAERARMLERALRELFDSAPSDEERDGFGKVSDEKSLAAFAEKLAQRPGIVSFAGSLAPARAWFSIAEADPNADKQPRVVLGPGEYPLPSVSARRGDAKLKIVGRSVGDRRTNDAQLLFEATEFTGARPPDPHKLEVPDGWGTWAIVCRPSDGFFYILHKGSARKIDYSKPREVTDTPANDLPAEFRDEVKRQLEIAGVSAELQAEVFEKPAPPAATADRDAVNAVRTAAAPGRYELGDGVQLQVRQVTKNGKPTNSSQILFLSPEPKVQTKVPHLEKLPLTGSTNRAPTQKAALGEPYDIGFYSPDAAYAFVWQRGANTLWVTEIREGSPIRPWEIGAPDRSGPQTVTLRAFDFSNPADVKLTHVSSSENGGGWSWGKIVPSAFHQPVLDALGERGKRLRDFIEPQKEKPKGAAVKLTPDALLGFWRGTMDGEDLMLSFHRPPVEKEVQLDIYFGEATIGSPAAFSIAADGGSALVGSGRADSAPFGTLRPIDANTMRLEGADKEGKAVVIAMLKRDVEEPATEPRPAEARELFEMWKRTANEDGTIPGTFIGQLATEVRTYVKANPNSDSGMNLPKLLPRFVTSRDWTQAEAIKLLDDVAYYSTEPIAARVAKTKRPSGPLWRTEVEFADIPVKIAKWSTAKDGLRIGMRVVDADWRIGGKARVELWLHNAGGNDVNFKTTGPDRQDVGVAVTAIDAEGRENRIANVTVLITALRMDCTLTAGHVAMAKRFDVTFHEAEKEWFAPGFHDLKPGKYQLRCKWTDANATISKPGEWKGELTAPDHAFTLAAAVTAADLKAKPAPKLAKLPDDAYAKPGVHCQKFREEDAKRPGGELMGSALESSQRADHAKEPLVLGVRTASDAQWRIGGTAKVGLIVRNRTGGIGRIGSGSDVKFSYTGRLDNGLSVVAVDESGKEYRATIAAFDGEFAFQQMLLPVAHVATIKEFTIRFDSEKRGVSEPHVAAFHLPPGKYKLRFKWNDARPDVAHEGEWTGELVNEELKFTLAAAVAAGQVRAPEVGEIVLHAIDVDTNKPIPNVTFVKENLLAEQWAVSVGRSNHDGTLTFRSKPLPGYFFSILPVPEGFKVAGLDEVPAGIRVGERIEHRFYLRKLGTNLQFLDELTGPPLTEQGLLIPAECKGQDSIKLSVHDMPGFTGQEVKFVFHRSNAKLAERVFRNGMRVRAALADELKYFRKAEGVKAGDISKVSEVIIELDSKMKWTLHCRTKNGMQLKQNGFRVHFDELDSWDLEVPALLHPEF